LDTDKHRFDGLIKDKKPIRVSLCSSVSNFLVLVMLDVQNLMVFFENALALNDFSMKVEEGEIVGVIGSNSAGKTTLMNTLSGLIIDMRTKEKRKGGERITVYGKIVYKGEDVTETSPSDRVKRALSFQEKDTRFSRKAAW